MIFNKMFDRNIKPAAFGVLYIDPYSGELLSKLSGPNAPIPSAPIGSFFIELIYILKFVLRAQCEK
jgi:hypothetical protein